MANNLPTPVTTDQKFMAKAAGMSVDLPTAITPEQKYLKAIAEGGSGGATNYNALSNKPQINSVELTGDKSGADLGLQSEITAQNKLDADLVDDTNAAHKFVTTAEKTKLNKAITTDEITIENDSFVLNGIRVYISATEPTGPIPEGSIWIPGGVVTT